MMVAMCCLNEARKGGASLAPKHDHPDGRCRVGILSPRVGRRSLVLADEALVLADEALVLADEALVLADRSSRVGK